MQITDVQLRLSSDTDREAGLLAYCSIVIDGGIIIYDLKVVQGRREPFIAMPSRKLTSRHGCGHKNELASRFCSNCGRRLPVNNQSRTHADMVHPINAECRRLIDNAVMQAYERTLKEQKVLKPQDPSRPDSARRLPS